MTITANTPYSPCDSRFWEKVAPTESPFIHGAMARLFLSIKDSNLPKDLKLAQAVNLMGQFGICVEESVVDALGRWLA